MEWHPDKYDGEDKKHAEKVFMDIAAAKEVLTDPGIIYFMFNIVKTFFLSCICGGCQSDSIGLYSCEQLLET